MSFKRQKLLTALARHGVIIKREGAEHTILGRVGGPSAAIPRHRELNRFTVRGAVRQLGLDWTIIEKDLK